MKAGILKTMLQMKLKLHTRPVWPCAVWTLHVSSHKGPTSWHLFTACAGLLSSQHRGHGELFSLNLSAFSVARIHTA